ncbi:hypothetical protein [Microbacterium sp. 13-71-7]|jgi:hypothetical protein|uniref:hypothetical protein n=1 Tax=Microbacterium sp. 13-71-7 TaxID=1970399 RepID=UPI0025DB5EF7|nr:hypothetical protein [Microbacterium sp. 13-71-7]
MDDDFESTLRRIVREELGHVVDDVATRRFSNASLAAAIRAEMSRTGRKDNELVAVLGLTLPTVRSRLQGYYDLKPGELEKVAAFLGIGVRNILESAALGDRLEVIRRGKLFSPEPLEVDDWAQPPRRRPHVNP